MNLTSMIQQERHRSLLVYLAVFALCAGLRIPMLDRSGLGVDQQSHIASPGGLEPFDLFGATVHREQW